MIYTQKYISSSNFKNVLQNGSRFIVILPLNEESLLCLIYISYDSPLLWTTSVVNKLESMLAEVIRAKFVILSKAETHQDFISNTVVQF
jgi:hypothetical protein